MFLPQNWCQELATNIVQLFTERMVIRMQHKPCPPWTLATDLGTGERGSLQGGRQMKACEAKPLDMGSQAEPRNQLNKHRKSVGNLTLC